MRQAPEAPALARRLHLRLVVLLPVTPGRTMDPPSRGACPSLPFLQAPGFSSFKRPNLAWTTSRLEPFIDTHYHITFFAVHGHLRFSILVL